MSEQKKEIAPEVIQKRHEYYMKNKKRIYAYNSAYRRKHYKELKERAANNEAEAIAELKKRQEYNTMYIFYRRSVVDDKYINKKNRLEKRLKRLQKKMEKFDKKANFWLKLCNRWKQELEKTTQEYNKFLEKVEFIKGVFEKGE